MKRRSINWDTRGLSNHFEMMISFSMFIFFVFFVLLFVRPQDNNYLSSSVIEGAHHNFLEISSIDVVTFFIDVDDLDPSVMECIQVELPDELLSDSYESSVAVRFFDEPVNSDMLLGTPSRIAMMSGDGDGSYYVYLSDSFTDDDLSTCTFAPQDEYDASLGSFRQERMVSFYVLESLEERYLSDYDSLRVDLGIPEVFDFAIVMDGLSMDIGAPDSVDVLARDYIEKVIYDDGTIEFKRITVKLWR